MGVAFDSVLNSVDFPALGKLKVTRIHVNKVGHPS